MSKFKVVTYNVNHSRRAEGPYAAHGWNERKEDVVALLRSLSAQVMLIQEIPCEAVEWFETQFPDHVWQHKNEPARGGNFTAMATGVPKNSTEKLSFMPDLPDFLSVYWPEEKCALINVHLPMQAEEREAALAKLYSVRKINSQIHNWVIGGDFNSFPDQGGSELLLKFNARMGTYSASEFAHSCSRPTQLAKKTFWPYPYDYVPEQALAMDGKLDHILVNGYLASSAVVHDGSRPKHNWAASDHFPVEVTLE